MDLKNPDLRAVSIDCSPRSAMESESERENLSGESGRFSLSQWRFQIALNDVFLGIFTAPSRSL
jgi:hypothetical protein